MKHWLFICFSLACNVAFGQWEYLKLNTKHRLIADKVNVRSSASDKGAVIANLPIGTAVTPILQTENTFKSDGVEAPWYKVKYQKDGKTQEGFIWGNLIAKGAAEAKDGSIFMFGVAKGGTADEGGWIKYSSQIRVCKGGKEIAKLVIDEGVGFMVTENVTLAEGRGFTGVKNIFTVEFVQESCGGVGNKLFFFWDGTKLYHVHSSSEGFDAPVYANEDQVFPDEKGGKPNQLYIKRESGNTEDPENVEYENFGLQWDGKKMTKVK